MKAALIPRMNALGMSSVRLDAMGNLIAEKGGGGSGRSMMLVAHAMNQPPNTMPDPYGGGLIDAPPHGPPGEAVRGEGAGGEEGTMGAEPHAMETVQKNENTFNCQLYFLCCGFGDN